MTSSALPTATKGLVDEQAIVHGRTYHRFMLGVKWAAIHLATLILFLVLWFCTPAGFLGALIPTAVVIAAAVFAMTHGLAHSTEADNPQTLEPEFENSGAG